MGLLNQNLIPIMEAFDKSVLFGEFDRKNFEVISEALSEYLNRLTGGLRRLSAKILDLNLSEG